MTRASNKLHPVGDNESPAHEEVAPRFISSALRIPPSLLASLVLFILAMGFNLYRLGEPSIWFDEAFSVELARQPLPLLWHIIFRLEPNMELYYLFLHFWLAFSSSLGLYATEFVVRLPSALFAGLGTVVVFLLARRYLSMIAGVAVASLYLLNNLQLVYAQQVRAYSLQVLLICIAWYALLEALHNDIHARRWWVCYVASTTLAIYTHLFSGLLVLAQLIAVGGLLLWPSPWQQRVRRQIMAFGISLVATSILVIPMIPVIGQGAKTGWLPVPRSGDLVALFITISGNKKWYLLALGICCLLGLAGMLLSSLPSRLIRQDLLKQSVIAKQSSFLLLLCIALCWLLVPVVVSYVISQGTLRLFSSRYLVTILPALFLLVGLGIAVLPRRMLQIGCALMLVALATTAVPQYYRSAQVEDWNATSHWLLQRYKDGDGLVCYHNGIQQGCQISVEYYLHAYPNGAHFSADSPGAFSWENFGSANPQEGPDAAVNPVALARYAQQHSRIFFIVGRLPDNAAVEKARAAQQWLDNHYRYSDQIVTRTVTIRLYVTP